MKKLIVKLLLVSLLVISASLLFAENTVSLNIKDMPVRDVITNLMAQSDVNIIMTDDPRMDKKIRINLTNYDLEKALNAIMMASGLSFKKIDDNTYVIGGSSAITEDTSMFNPDTLLSNINEAPVTTGEVPVANNDSMLSELKVIELAHVGASELLNAMGWNTNRANYSGSSNYRTHNARVKYYDNGQVTTPSVNPYINDGSGRTASLNNLSGARSNNNSNSNSGSSRNNNNNNNSNSNSNSNSGSSDGFGGAKSFIEPYEDYFDSLVAYDLNNSIMVRGNKQAIQEFQKDVAKFDIPPRQVECKCEFVSISTDITKQFGIDWAIESPGRYFETMFNPSGNVGFYFASGNLTAQVTAELTDKLGKVVNSPIITTLNNIEGSISITHTVPSFSSSISGDGVNPVATYSNSDIEITSDLYVTPRINRDNSITMIIEANIGDDLGEVQSPDGKSSTHETLDQEIEVIRRVYDGETVVIGGFVRQEQSRSISKIPLLGDLPILGPLFRNENKTVNDQELLIFITPRIIHDSINMNKLMN